MLRGLVRRFLPILLTLQFASVGSEAALFHHVSEAHLEPYSRAHCAVQTEGESANGQEADHDLADHDLADHDVTDHDVTDHDHELRPQDPGLRPAASRLPAGGEAPVVVPSFACEWSPRATFAAALPVPGLWLPPPHLERTRVLLI